MPLSAEERQQLIQQIPHFESSPILQHLADKKLLPQQHEIPSFAEPDVLTQLRRSMFGHTKKEQALITRQEEALVPFLQEQKIKAALEAQKAQQPPQPTFGDLFSRETPAQPAQAESPFGQPFNLPASEITAPNELGLPAPLRAPLSMLQTVPISPAQPAQPARLGGAPLPPSSAALLQNPRLAGAPFDPQIASLLTAIQAPTKLEAVDPEKDIMQPFTGEIVRKGTPKEKDEELAKFTAMMERANIDPKGPEGQALYRDYAIKTATHPKGTVTNINTFLPASEEAQRDFMKSTRATYDQLKQAPVLLKNIEAAKALVPKAKGFMGTGGETLLEAAKFLNNRLGTSINIAGIKNAEELRSRIFFNIMDNLKKMDAQPSQMQQQIMMESLGKLGTDPNALPAVLDAYADVIRGKVELHNKEVLGAVTRGVKFPYDPTISIFDYTKIKSGETYTAPDGTTRRKP